MVRFRKLRAGRRAQEIATWTIGIVVVLGLWFLGSLLLRHLGVP